MQTSTAELASYLPIVTLFLTHQAQSSASKNTSTRSPHCQTLSVRTTPPPPPNRPPQPPANKTRLPPHLNQTLAGHFRAAPKHRHDTKIDTRVLRAPARSSNTPAPRPQPPLVPQSSFSPARRFPHYQKAERLRESKSTALPPTSPPQGPQQQTDRQTDRQTGTLSPPRAFPHSAFHSMPELPASLPSPSLNFRLVPTQQYTP